MVHGITTLHIEGLALSQTGELRNTGPEVAYSLAKKVNRDEAQAIFLSCTNFRTIELISALEQELKKPVISSNTATLWDALRRLKIKEPVLGYGQIFHNI